MGYDILDYDLLHANWYVHSRILIYTSCIMACGRSYIHLVSWHVDARIYILYHGMCSLVFTSRIMVFERSYIHLVLAVAILMSIIRFIFQ